MCLLHFKTNIKQHQVQQQTLGSDIPDMQMCLTVAQILQQEPTRPPQL